MMLLPAMVQGQGHGMPLEDILAAVTAPSPANIRVAEKAWLKQGPLSADVLTKYAMSLALVSNNRHVQAFELIEGIPHSARKGGPLRRLFVWLSVKLKKDDLAAAEIQSLLDELKTRSANMPTEKDLEDVIFAGKLVAYLQLVAEREEPLAPTQAKNWWQSLTSLPAPWSQNLAAISQSMTDLLQVRAQGLQDSFAPWKEKKEGEFTKVQAEVASLAQAEAIADTELKTAVDAANAFARQSKPQRDNIVDAGNDLIRQRDSIRRPSRPSKPKKDKDGKTSSADEREYDRDMDRYEEAMKKYDAAVGRINGQINGLQGQLNAINAQQRSLELDEANKRAAHIKTEKPLEVATKKEQLIKQQLADRPTWDSPSALVTLKALDAYVTIDFAKEVARIQAARLR